MPYCPQCGIDNPAAARYCDQCGAALVPVAQAPMPAPMPAPVPAPMPAPVSQAAPAITPMGATICPQCGMSAIPGEAFCDNCGAPLNAPQRPTAPVPIPPYSAGLPQQPQYPPPQPVAPIAQPSQPVSPLLAPLQPATPPSPTFQFPASSPQPTRPISAVPPMAPARVVLAPARLVIATSNAILPLPNAPQVIIGRADPVSNAYPDVDLTPHGALDQGVGRRHARVFVQNGQFQIEDLNSTNGTLLNGRRLAPQQPQVLRDGDLIQIGKMMMRIQF